MTTLRRLDYYEAFNKQKRKTSPQTAAGPAAAYDPEMPRLPLCSLLSLLLLVTVGPAFSAELAYKPAGVGNPLQGLVPYDNDWAAYHAERGSRSFPHTLEFCYFGLAELASQPGRFDFAAFDAKLDAIAGRGHQAVVRIYMEFPGRTNGVPAWLEEQGVAVTRWNSDAANEFEQGRIATPDYDDPRTRQLLTEFIAALGSRYDGDPRLGFLTAGLMGLWGEWHNYPRSELFASKPTQSLVLDAFAAAFDETPVQLRYPAGDAHLQYVRNTGRGFGYHDDSFAFGTLDTGREADNWFFMPLMSRADALDIWKQYPIGGEIRPEVWGKIFDAPAGQPSLAGERAQDFAECVDATHVTWLMDSGLNGWGAEPPSDTRWTSATDRVARMGYEFHVSDATRQDTALSVTIRSTGVAPLYHDWLPVLGDGEAEVATDWSLVGLLPGESRTFRATLPAGFGPVRMQIPNALETGPPIRFANATQDRDAAGWVSLE